MDEADVHQILVDVSRTRAKDFGISDPEPAATFKEALEDLLLRWLGMQTQLQYIQGVNELMAVCLINRTREEASELLDQLVSQLPDGMATVAGDMAPAHERGS